MKRIRAQLSSGAVASLFLSVALSGCGGFSTKGGMPARNETVSFSGPGQEKVTRGVFPKILFAEDSAQLTSAEQKKLTPVIAFLKEHPEARLLIAGRAQDTGTDEYNRVLGEQRAQAVREALLTAGCIDEHLQTLSLGSDLPAGGGSEGRSVELGIVR